MIRTFLLNYTFREHYGIADASYVPLNSRMSTTATTAPVTTIGLSGLLVQSRKSRCATSQHL